MGICAGTERAALRVPGDGSTVPSGPILCEDAPMASLMDRFPSISDLEARARRRIPRFAWEYLAAGTGRDEARDRNLTAMEDIHFVPRLLLGEPAPSLATTLFGIEYAAPIGMAPIGLTGLIWPDAEGALARLAATQRLPFVLSTVGTASPEVVGPETRGMGWFQLYPPRDETLRTNLIDRARAAGFTTMVVTADVPAPSRRERQRRAGVRVPPAIGPRLMAQAVLRPAWMAGVVRHGLPRFKGLEDYIDRSTMAASSGFIGANLGGTLSWSYLAAVRAQWEGALVVKGILHPDDAQRSLDTGADAVQVSNHGGRQLDGAPGAIAALPSIVERIGSAAPVLFDGGVRSGLDVARAIAVGASMVFCGRAFMFGLGALGERGAEHTYRILEDDLRNVMAQTGCRTLQELSARLA